MRRLAALAIGAALFLAGAFIAPSEAGPRPGPSAYVVEPGDSWVGIARKVGIAAQTLVSANCDLAVLNTTKCPLHPGRILFFYPQEVTPSTTTTSTTSSTTTTAPPASSTTASSAPTFTTATTLPPSPDSSPSTTPTNPASFSESFSTPAGMDRLVFDVHNDGTWPLRSFEGDHNHACMGPTTYRPLVEQRDDVNGVTDMVWWCAPTGDGASGHFMTGMNTEGYTIIAFTPKAANGLAQIFPATANRICWDQNLTDLGGRKWTQLAVVSDDTYLALNPTVVNPRLAFHNPDFVDVAGETSPSIGADGFLFNNLRNSTEFFTGTNGVVIDDFGLPGVTDKAARYKICVRDNGNGTVTRTQVRPGGAVHTVTGPGRFPAGPRVFVLEDDTYNADKDRDGGVPASGNPYTWHWDNIEISAS